MLVPMPKRLDCWIDDIRVLSMVWKSGWTLCWPASPSVVGKRSIGPANTSETLSFPILGYGKVIGLAEKRVYERKGMVEGQLWYHE